MQNAHSKKHLKFCDKTQYLFCCFQFDGCANTCDGEPIGEFKNKLSSGQMRLILLQSLKIVIQYCPCTE